MLSREELIEGARKAHGMGAKRYCIVTSGRGPSKRDINHVCEVVRKIKTEIPIQVCTSLGLLTEEPARQLKDAGVDRYNHNLESSKAFFPSFCTSHSYSDRFATARIVKSVGMELCSGGLVGMGETFEDRVSLAFALSDLGADSIPVNFLNPRPGTPMEALPKLTPGDCLRTLAMFRLVHPGKEIRVAGGRESCIGHMQVLSLYAANSLFTTGYLTTPGQGYEADMEMIAQAGFKVTEYIE
jgi:biotin synthase